ncbi:UvrD-helicase domain-containing protein [Azospira inquinata]|uniref:DNA 3'-5' helicase n=1 Tax=Azospira inquinata TaxID=2785627 RepID=A0A975SLG4_9RHOO|nr:UvrD-helicase domain-containing protein [Azospira inquinata]QWT46152.1 UvrD-helicase domain-containing protein [Azospira inquinata]QWT48519.1 UvrD-helicase domain-containing protein [Azospira inquinata]
MVDALIAQALDPHRSVVVEACAGSGKTWLLASRILRLLLEGTAPGDILAITFTRKAAREIEERVMGWLGQLAAMEDREAAAFLEERAMDATPARLRAARGLYERVADAQPGLSVHTFHGWFLQLVGAAPLTSGLAGTSLVDSGKRLLDELWQGFAGDLQQAPESPPAQAFVALLRELGLESLKHLVFQVVARRGEWLAYGTGAASSLDRALTDLGHFLGAGAPGQALAGFFKPGWDLEFQAYLGLLEQNDTATDKGLAATLAQALARGEALTQAGEPVMVGEEEGSEAGEVGENASWLACFQALRGVLLTQSGTVRARKSSKALDKRLGAGGAARFLSLHAQLAEALLGAEEGRLAERILAFNRRGLTLAQAFLDKLEAHKGSRRLIDFTDAEWQVLRLLRDDSQAAFLLARLDSRYRHILLDEFQDTNPLQWQILLAWLDAYGPGETAPTLFLVGDPKQSIYRFRQAEPRLFSRAKDFLLERFQAVFLAQDRTRRNAPALIRVVNALFGPEELFQPFRNQESLALGLPGRVELLPLCAGEEGEPEAPTALRDPLTEPEAEAVDPRRAREGAALAARLQAMVGHWQVVDGTGQRAARYGDVMLLVRKRTQLAEYERALRAAGIPYLAASRGGLLHTLEARDMGALLEFLVLPAADLKLAHVLRTPLFACTDPDLLALAHQPEPTWWEGLQGLVARGQASPRLARAARLLGQWLEGADRLPAHDLLDRIYHQGEALARYREAVAPAVWPGVEANLQALLQLALDLDGGRYPSLPRFIDELAELRQADPDEAPDEGLVEGEDDGQGRVRILTIHAAKGLEAPIVWLLDANAPGNGRQDAYEVLTEWPPEADRPTHFSLYGRKEERGRAREPLFETEANLAAREELNLLYVALTRAKQVFVASGSENSRAVASPPPYQRLSQALATLGVEGGGEGQVYGEELPCTQDGDEVSVPAAVSPEAGAEAAPLGLRREAPEGGALFGVLLHAILEQRTGGITPAPGWWRALGAEDGEARAAEKAAQTLLQRPELAPFLFPGPEVRAWNEAEVVDGEGQVRRVDRLLETPTQVWVVDYKSSSPETPRLAEYQQQVGEYCALLAPVFAPKPVKGWLLFAAGALVPVV